ncbi:hypothetical protein N9L76_10875 [bacterium]|nr:hypothetical protein [bacterium]
MAEDFLTTPPDHQDVAVAAALTVGCTMLSTRQLQRAVPRGYPAAAVDAARQALGDANKVRTEPHLFRSHPRPTD